MRFLLQVAGSVYRGLNRARRALYRAGVLRARRLPVPVIAIGNIGVGGGGKTPAVIAIARALSERGLRVAVLTRGYARTGAGGLVTTLDADRFGDEPVLIKKSVPNVDVIVATNRYENALRHSCDVFLLDDGFQHLQLHRDLDIVIDAPAAYYRESRAALRDADIVMPRTLGLSVPQSLLQGKRVFAFAGLANNEQFFDALRQAGVNVIGSRGFKDHHRYTADDIAGIKAEAANADAIATTEKDAVKIDDAAIVAVPAAMVIAPDVLERILAVVRR